MSTNINLVHFYVANPTSYLHTSCCLLFCVLQLDMLVNILLRWHAFLRFGLCCLLRVITHIRLWHVIFVVTAAAHIDIAFDVSYILSSQAIFAETFAANIACRNRFRLLPVDWILVEILPCIIFLCAFTFLFHSVGRISVLHDIRDFEDILIFTCTLKGCILWCIL